MFKTNENLTFCDLKNYCRICLNYNNEKILIYSNKIHQELESLFNIKIQILDEQNDSICNDCYQKLKLCVELKSSLTFAESLLATLIDSENSKNNQENVIIKNEFKENNLILSEEKNEIKPEEDNLDNSTNYSGNEDFEEKNINDYLPYKHLEKYFRLESKDNRKINKKEIKSLYNNKKKLDILKNYQFQCKYCCEIVDNITCIQHITKHTDEIIKCTLCDKVCSAKYALYEHFKMYHQSGGQHHPCKFCNKTFPLLSRLKIHVKFAHEKKRIKCKMCEKDVDLRQYKKHCLQVHNEKNFSCNYCEKKFTTLDQLTKHTAIIHNPDKICNYCGKKLSRFNLKPHMRTHIQDRNFKCNLCDRAFIWKYNLKNHIRNVHSQHSDEPKQFFACDKCDKRYTRNSSLKYHIRHNHENLRPYKCDICEKAFFNEQHLKNHFNVHTGARPYVCNICNDSFGFSSTLHTHKKLKHKI